MFSQNNQKIVWNLAFFVLYLQKIVLNPNIGHLAKLD